MTFADILTLGHIRLGDASKLTMALMACLLGYGEVGLWLKKQSEVSNSWAVLEGNPYKQWMDEYAGEAYQNAVKIGLGLSMIFPQQFFFLFVRC